MDALRRKLLPALLSGLILLASCASNPFSTTSASGTITESSVSSAATTTLNFRITWKEYSGRGEAIRTITDAYNLSSADTSVSVVGGDEDRAAIEELLSSDPNTIYMLPYRYVQYFGDLGLLLDITDSFVEQESLFYPEIWSLGTVDGKSYGVPWLGHSMCLLYNKSLLTEAGVDPDSINSTDTLVDALEKIESTTDADGIGLVGAESNDLSWMVNQFIYGFGSSLVSESGDKVTVNDDASATAIYFYRDTLGSHAQPSWKEDTGTEVMDAFRAGEIAFEIQGIWGVTDILKNGSPFEVGVISLGTIGVKSEVGPMMAVIPAGMDPDKILNAVDFIRYLTSTDAQAKIMNGEYSPEHDAYYPFRTPIRKDMAENDIFTAHPEYALFLEGFSNPSIDVPVPRWQIIKDEIYQPGLHLVMTGEMTVEDFLLSVEEEGDLILKKTS